MGRSVGLVLNLHNHLLLKNPKTVKQAEFAHQVNHGVDKLVVIGTFTLLISGLIMGILNTHLFTQGWYIISLILFITILPVAGAIVPKKAAKQVEILKNHNGDQLPESYLTIKKQAVPFYRYTYAATVIIVILMVTKPFI